MAGKKNGEPSWRYRRLAIYAVTIWGCFQLWLLVDSQDTRVNETIAWGWQVMILALVLGYTGFATVQDMTAIWRTRSGKPYSQDAAPPEGWPADIAPPEHDDRGAG
jgi:hypothetical protein